MISWLLALALLGQSAVPLSEDALARVSPALAAISAEEARQAALPPPAGDKEKLVRMGRLDQVGRAAASSIDLTGLPDDQRDAANHALWGTINEIDLRNQAELMTMIPAEGWFLRSVYGEEAAQAAFLIVQHGNVEMWRRFVPVLEPLVASGEAPGGAYALMYDRLAMNEDRPQRYGSQMRCEDHRWVPYRLEDPARVDEWRAAMGMSTFAENIARFADLPPCG